MIRAIILLVILIPMFSLISLADGIVNMDDGQVDFFYCTDGKIGVDSNAFNTAVMSCSCEAPHYTMRTEEFGHHELACGESVDLSCSGQIYPVLMTTTTARALCTDVGATSNIYLPIILSSK